MYAIRSYYECYLGIFPLLQTCETLSGPPGHLGIIEPPLQPPQLVSCGREIAKEKIDFGQHTKRLQIIRFEPQQVLTKTHGFQKMAATIGQFGKIERQFET